ncbi:hypothetical protein N657DRAFT_683104 [Parathielavia appendiculata]|uniref:Thymidylate kinase n=1 Tax=Parathielavia appendiculata TaxID=2587402 RepID=A0AAN6TW13_9PEZI|nr:hypothetical protein N657DRAFT_683104 [Parathielavia appendiculata]
MAILTRQPFAPVDGTRLQSLASVKNRQNAISASPIKRKASEVEDVANSENIAPVSFSPKRSKGVDFWDGLSKGFTKSPAFTLTKAAYSPVVKDVLSSPPSRLSSAPRPRDILQPKSPAARLIKAKSTAPSPLTAPAGRSPTRASKRMGILSRRRISRPDPPSFSLGAASVPFSLDAALKGTIPSYSGSLRRSAKSSSRKASSTSSSSSGSSGSNASAPGDFFIPTPDTKSSWCFNIHEDTPEQEMTNLLQHGTHTLDISSDEESESRAKRDRAEGRDKENIPPPEDVSQTSTARGVGGSSSRSSSEVGRVEVDEDVLLLKGRGPLAEMNVADFYAEGCDSSSVFIVPGDEEDPEAVVVGEAAETAADIPQQAKPLPPLPADGEEEQQWFAAAAAADGMLSEELHAPQVSLDDVEGVDVDDIMGGHDRSALEEAAAAGLGPIEGAGESFELWESNSSKDEGDAPSSPAPLPADDYQSASVVVF